MDGAPRVLVLGPLAIVEDGGTTVDVTGHAGRLLAELVAHGPVVARGRLIEALWPTDPPKSADAALRVHLSRLRRLIEAAGGEIRRRPTGHELAGVTTDLAHFHRLIADARDRRTTATAVADLDQAATLVDDALALWRGEPFGPFDDDLELVDDVEHARSLRLAAEDLAGDLILERGLHREALSDLERAAVERPFHEQCWARLMLALYRSGRQRDALAAFERARHVLVEELGVEPGPELRRRQHDILIQHPALDWTSPSERPPLAPADPAATTGRAPLQGRDKDIARILAALDDGALVTVTGPPGIGKSEVVAAVGERWKQMGPAFVLDIESVAAVDLLPFALADELGLRPDPGTTIELIDLVAGALSVTPSLLVVDGGEHLDPGVARFVAQLLARADRLCVLVGHRAALELPGERVLELPMLDFDDALALLVDRLPAGAATMSDHEALERVVRAVSGHPLALELAAGWVELLGAAEVAAQLEAGLLPLATSGAGSILERVRVTLELVDAPTRNAFSRLGVFQSDFNAEALAAITGISPRRAATVVRELRRVSLIQPAGTRGWYRLLAGVRDAARELAEREGVADEAADAMLRWLERCLAPWQLPAFGLDAAGVGAALEPWRADLRAVFESAVQRGDLEVAAAIYHAQNWFWNAGGHRQESARAGEMLRPLCDADPTNPVAARCRAELCLAGGTFAWHAQHLPDAEQALLWAEGSGDPMSLYMARSAVALGCGWSGDLARAQAMIDALKAENLSRSTYPYLSILPFELDGILAMAGGDFARSREALEQVRADYESIGSIRGEADAFQALGWVASFEGDDERAEACYRVTASKAEIAGDLHTLVHARIGLADLLAGAGRWAEARQEFSDVLPALADFGDIGCTAQCFCGLAEVGLAMDDAESVEWLLADAASLATKVSDGGVLLRAIVGLADLARERGRIEDAARLLGCLASSTVSGGRPLRAVDTQRLDELRARLGADLDQGALAALHQEGEERGSAALVAQIRTDLTISGASNPLDAPRASL